MALKRAKGARGKCDVIFSKLVRSRGRCERCGTTDYSKLQAAHCVPRRYSQVRTDLRNAWACCASCHFIIDTHADEKMALVRKTIGMRTYQQLKKRALSVGKFDWDAELERLRALQKKAA